MTEASTNGTSTRAGRRAAVARPANGRNTTQPNLQERGSGLPERALNYASTGALEDPARPWKREIDDMIQRDPQIQAVMIALILPLLTAEGHVEPGDKDSGEAKFIEQCLTAPEWDGGMTTPIHMILEQEATAMFYRQAFFEKVWLRDADGKFRYKKLAFRPATTCRIRHDIGEGPNGSGNGSFNGFMQEGVRPGSGEWFTEEFDPLYAYVFVHGHAQRPLLGTSLLQTAWHEHMHKNKLRWLQFRGFAKWGNGILVAETERMDDTEQDELTDALNEVLDGGALVVGEGEMPQLLTASGSAGFLEVLQYIDTGIARSVLLQALQLGTGSNTGSWALSKDHTDFYLMSCEARLRQIEYTRNAYMIPPLIEQNYPGTPSYPTWHFPGLSEEGKELAKEIFIALLGRPQASVHPVIKATVEKTVAQKLGGDPDNIPEWDDPEREVEQVPPDAAADTEPTNDPQRAAEAGALQSSLQALRGETGQRAASEVLLREYVRDEAGRFATVPGNTFVISPTGQVVSAKQGDSHFDAAADAGARGKDVLSFVSGVRLHDGTLTITPHAYALGTGKAKDPTPEQIESISKVLEAYERSDKPVAEVTIEFPSWKEEGALASVRQRLEMRMVAASEQGDTPLGESVTYERFLALADLYGDDEAERLLREQVASDKILAAMLSAAQHGNEEGFRFLANRYWHLQPRDNEGKWTETGRGAGGLKARAIERVKGFGDRLRTEAPAAEPAAPQRGEAMGRAPISDKLRVPRAAKANARKKAEAVFEAIDGLHGMPAGTDLALVRDETEDYLRAPYDGVYRHLGSEARGIRFRPNIARPHTTVAHETGHYLEHQDFGTEKGSWGSRSPLRDRPAAQVVDVARNTPTIQRLEASKRRARGNPGQQYKADYLDYASSPQEVFARAYAQWVVMNAPPGNSARAEYEKKSKQKSWSLPGEQWPPEEFVPIAAKFDELFGRR